MKKDKKKTSIYFAFTLVCLNDEKQNQKRVKLHRQDFLENERTKAP